MDVQNSTSAVAQTPRTFDDLRIDLSDLDFTEIEVLIQEGGRGMPEYAASSGTNCQVACSCSCGTGCKS